MKPFPQALTIAGSDSGGGAGIQTDLKTFQMRGVFGTAVITAITAQNTLGVFDIYPVPLATIQAQLNAVCEDFQCNAVKIGMLANATIIETVAERIRHYGLKNIVLDPVMIAKGGAKLLDDGAIHALQTALIPLCDVLTPNLPECEVLTGIQVTDQQTAYQAAQKLQQLGAKNVLIKGGHTENLAGDRSDDWLFTPHHQYVLSAERFNTPHTHGTGCTLSTCIAAELAKGASVEHATRTAKTFITNAISHPLNIGRGHGPLNLWAGNNALMGETQ